MNSPPTPEDPARWPGRRTSPHLAAAATVLGTLLGTAPWLRSAPV